MCCGIKEYLDGRVEKGVVVGERRKDVVFICESRRGS
jgi:hypothetical protein